MRIEVKKDNLRQTQDGTWKLGFTLKSEDMPIELMIAPMGQIYYIDIKDAEEEEYNAEYTEVEFRPVEDKPEGERLRIRSAILCQDNDFQNFCYKKGVINVDRVVLRADAADEDNTIDFIYMVCDIKSRSELVTNAEAQNKFKDLLRKYDDWEYENRYK